MAFPLQYSLSIRLDRCDGWLALRLAEEGMLDFTRSRF